MSKIRLQGRGRRREGEVADPWREIRARVPLWAIPALEEDVQRMRDAGNGGAGLANALVNLAIRRARERELVLLEGLEELEGDSQRQSSSSAPLSASSPD